MWNHSEKGLQCKTSVKYDPIKRIITYINPTPEQVPQPQEGSYNQVFDYLQYMNHNMNNQFAHLYSHANVPPYEVQPYHYPFIQPQDEGQAGNDFANDEGQAYNVFPYDMNDDYAFHKFSLF